MQGGAAGPFCMGVYCHYNAWLLKIQYGACYFDRLLYNHIVKDKRSAGCRLVSTGVAIVRESPFGGKEIQKNVQGD